MFKTNNKNKINSFLFHQEIVENWDKFGRNVLTLKNY